MTDLTALIQRLADAKKGSRELDNEIAVAVGWEYREHVQSDWKWRAPGADGQAYLVPPSFTRSLDAAMTLVSEGMAVDLYIGPRALANDAVVTEPVQSIDDQDRRVTSWKQHEARAARDGTLHWNTPALALCLASLRARQQQKQGER